MSLRTGSVGARIKEAREGKQMTQQEIAKLLGLSRAAVAQWESNTTSPSIQTASEVAKILEKSPQWIAFGVGTEPTIEYRQPEGSVTLKEVQFGEKPADTLEGRSWNVPADYLRSELNCPNPDSLIIWRVESPNMAPLYEYGDKVIIDVSAKRPTPSGTFLIWDGIGPSLNQVSVKPGQSKPVAVVSSTASGESYEIAADRLVVLGRVRGLLKNV